MEFSHIWFETNHNDLVFVDVDEEYFLNLQIEKKDNFHYLFLKDNNFSSYGNDDILKKFHSYNYLNFYLIKSKTNDDYELFFNLVINYFKNINSQPIFNRSKYKNLSFYINNSVDIINPKTFMNIIKLFKSYLINKIYIKRNDYGVDFGNLIRTNHIISADYEYKCNKNGFNNFNANYVMEFMDDIINLCCDKYSSMKLGYLEGLIDYGNIIPCGNILHGHKCSCPNKNDILNNFYKIKLKILEYYIKCKNGDIEFKLKSNLDMSDNKRLKWTGTFLNNIKDGFLILPPRISLIFINSWDLIIDGLNILLDIKNNNGSSLKLMDINISSLKKINNKDVLIYSKTLEPFNLVNDNRVKSRNNIYSESSKPKSNDYPNYGVHFLNYLNDNNFSFYNIDVSFKDYYQYDKNSINNYYKEFINFLKNQVNIKILRILKYDQFGNTEHYINDMCLNLQESEIHTLKLNFDNLKKSDIDILENFIMNSFITEISLKCDRLIYNPNELSPIESIIYVNKVKQASKIPIDERTIPLKTITNVKSASKRYRDYDDDEENNNNGDIFEKDTKFFKKM